MNGNKRTRAVVIVVSIVICLGGFGLYAYYRWRGVGIPPWDGLAMAYGGVFVLFYAFDTLSKQFARLRVDVPGPRPRPVPGARVMSPAGTDTAGSAAIAPAQVRLERARAEDQDELQTMIDVLWPEVLALDEQRPERDVQGHVTAVRAQQWLTDPRMYSFFIVANGARIGCCALAEGEHSYRLEALYVQSAWRRRQAGRNALHQLTDFARMMGSFDAVHARLSTANLRGRRFLTACGFVKQAVEDHQEQWGLSWTAPSDGLSH